MDLPVVKTRAQLFNQLLDARWSSTDLGAMVRAYRLAEILFAGQVRADGQPFLDHLIGTTGVVVAAGGDAATCCAALLHSAYILGEFGDGTRKRSDTKRATVREAIGADAEQLVAVYTELRWDCAAMHELARNAESLPATTRRLVMLRAANALDDHRDLGMRYRGLTGAELGNDPEIPAMIELAEAAGCAGIAGELRRAVEAEVCAEIPSVLTLHNEHYAVRPRSTRLRLTAWLRAEETVATRAAHRWLWRFRRAMFRR